MDSLPELPKTHRKREAKVTPAVLRWFRENYPSSVALEVKATSGLSIPRSALLDHQRQALLDASRIHGIAHKIADTGRRLPFDAFVLKNTPAFVVACFTRFGVGFAVPIDQWSGLSIVRNEEGGVVPRVSECSPDGSPTILRIPLG